MKTLYRVSLMPIDPLLFSDNRSARAGEDHLIRDQDPSPHTIYGAIGANIASKLDVKINSSEWEKAKEYLGEFETSIENGSEDRSELICFFYADSGGKAWFPRPRHIMLRESGNMISTGMPVEITPQKDLLTSSSLSAPDHFLSIKRDDHETDKELLFSQGMLKKTLCGTVEPNTPLNPGGDILTTDKIYLPETRLGIGMDSDKNNVLESVLFSRPYRRFASDIKLETSEWSSAAIIAYFQTLKALSETQLSNKPVAFLGGDRARTLISFQKENELKPLPDLKQEVRKHVGGSTGFFCYLLTPAVKESKWPQINGIDPLAISTGKTITISGWDTNTIDQHPRPIRQLIPAGSVFFYKWASPDDNDRKALIDQYWLEPIAANHKYRNSGFGRILIGVWK